jgi:hypothetical protein
VTAVAGARISRFPKTVILVLKPAVFATLATGGSLESEDDCQTT